VVDVEDSSGTLLSSDSSNVTLRVSGNATLGGTVTVEAVNGVATFSDLHIANAGNYTLNASDGALNSTTSDTFAVGGSVLSNATPLTIAITKSTLSASVVAGTATKAKVTLKLTNPGAVLQSGTVSLFASTDGSIDGTSIALAPSHALTLKGHASASLTLTLPTLSADLLGTYTLMAEVTDGSGDTRTAAGASFTSAAPFTAFSEQILAVTGGTSGISGKKTNIAVKLLITNTGNVESSGNTTLAISASPTNQGSPGTPIRSITGPLLLKSHASRLISIPLLAFPLDLNGSYFFVVQTTDSHANVTTVTTARSFAIAAPVFSVVPSLPRLVVSKNGTGVLNFTLTNPGNIPATGTDTLTLIASDDASVLDATTVISQPLALTLAPTHAHAEHLKLTAPQIAQLQAATLSVLEVTDSLGNTQTLTL
jgi:hypothetical protein